MFFSSFFYMIKKQKMTQDQIIKEYIHKKTIYKKLTSTVASLTEVLLGSAHINYQKIESRTKGVRSLERKMKKKFIEKKQYHSLFQIPDLSAVRIIVFFKDDIDNVVEIIEKEFKVHLKENLDLKIQDTPKEFGYQSKHRIISINHQRSNLKEYKIFENIKCEVQIRTVLQHAWAEIEHDIGYKSEIEEDSKERIELTRMFAQNAALLEVADNNFLKIKKVYENILKRYRSSIIGKDLNLPLNIDSMREYFQNTNQYDALDDSLTSKNLISSEAVGKARENKINNIKDMVEVRGIKPRCRRGPYMHILTIIEYF